MSQTTSVSHLIFKQTEPIFAVHKTDSTIVIGGKLVAGALINSAITVAALFETAVCAALTVAVFPALLTAKTSGLPKFFKDHTLAAIHTASQSAKAIFGHKMKEPKVISSFQVARDIILPVFQNIKTVSQKVLNHIPKPLVNLQTKHYVLISAGVVTTLLLGYGIYNFFSSVPPLIDHNICEVTLGSESINATYYNPICEGEIGKSANITCLFEKAHRYVLEATGMSLTPENCHSTIINTRLAKINFLEGKVGLFCSL